MAQATHELKSRKKARNSAYAVLSKKYAQYKLSFFSERASIKKKARPGLIEAWQSVAADKLTEIQIDELLVEMNKKTSKKGLFIFAMELGETIGTDPLLLAADLQTIDKTKSFLTGLLNKVKENLKK